MTILKYYCVSIDILLIEEINEGRVKKNEEILMSILF